MKAPTKLASPFAPIRIEKKFYPEAQKMRAHFESRFNQPLVANGDRFVWDYWLVENQYKLLRTPAENFFPKKIYQPFLEHLLGWGRKNLGCQMISHPWLSVYIDGCHQSLHSDVPHGPWSFVYSLTPWSSRRFRGGETIIATPKLLNYFSNYTHDQSDETKSLFTQIEPHFNQLTIFDPRYPHGVNPVHGEDDLLRARLVIHGWFTEPRPTIEGALSTKKALPTLDVLAMNLIRAIESVGANGLLSLKLTITASGKISNTDILCAHLINDQGQCLPKAMLARILAQVKLETPPFAKSSGTTHVTLPIEFRK